MDSPSHSRLNRYTKTIRNVIDAGKQVIQSLPEDQEDKDYAYEELLKVVEDLRIQTGKLEPRYSIFGNLFEAAMEMQAGYLLVEAQRGIERGDKGGIQRALNNLVAEQEASAGNPITDMKFEDDLLRPPARSRTAASALADFKKRAERTLDNMVKEAQEVLSSAIKELKETFDQFFKVLEKLMNSFSPCGGSIAITEAIGKIIGSLKKMAGLLKNQGLKQLLASLKEMVHSLDLEALVAKAFGCAGTKDAVAKLRLSSRMDVAKLHAAGARMAELSQQYVLRLKQMKRLLRVVGALGGVLLLTGVATDYTELSLPVAYALIALTIILVGINFAEIKMRRLVANL